MDFVDSAKIYVRSGAGGNGCVSFRREKYVPMGGPDGGDGGRGGSVTFVASQNLWTLRDFKYQQHYYAEDGNPGGSTQKTGHSGKDLLVEVPVGTLILDEESKHVLADLSQPGEQFIAARGGKGGRGNMFFTTSTNQAPHTAEEGTPGQSLVIRLELKLLADVALVGLPNAGKSTLLAAISHARPKIGDYPFTTLVPQLGMVDINQAHGFVVADVPGLIAGAHEGKGLGIRFLKHLERSRLLWFVIDASDLLEDHPAPQQAYEILRQEISAYKDDLAHKPHMVVLNKIDLNPQDEYSRDFCRILDEKKIPFFRVSGATKKGLPDLLQETQKRLQTLKNIS